MEHPSNMEAVEKMSLVFLIGRKIVLVEVGAECEALETKEMLPVTPPAEFGVKTM